MSESSEVEEAVWTFPSTDMEKLKYKVFCDLWEKGHFLTAGSKFGGDFLVYAGEFHISASYYSPDF